ncbi:MAG: penicillin acylase family protein [Pyrinomonadaceae bacterium]
MLKRQFVLIAILSFASLTYANPAELTRWQQQAANVTITRDTWGIAHVKGKTDADAVFGAIYAQAEDDFNRIEVNYLNSLGRLAEAEGEGAIWSDLRQRLFIDEAELKQNFNESPDWLKKLMVAWADGLNFYLATHPNVKPRVITKFEPWMPLSFSEGSIGGDIESIDLGQLQAFYDKAARATVAATEKDLFPEPLGSNGIAIAPKNTKDGKALLLINPHTSFYFRSELQMTSDEGLNAYGASTWGQFFIYQGFNERLGWMHTSNDVDAIDEWLETVVKKSDKYAYKHGTTERPMTTKSITIHYTSGRGASQKTFVTYRTHHGPVIRAAGDMWVSIGLMHEPVKALMQSYGRTKAKNLAEFKKIMDLHANSSNATLYSDADGNIAYFHPNFIPKRDTKFDWTKPVDGSDPATDWGRLLTMEESPTLINPASGWVYNSNNWPWSAAGPSSLKQSDYPKYVDNGVESARGIHAIRLLENKKDFTLESLNTTAYDSQVPWFEKPIPALVKAWDALPTSDPLKTKLSEQIKMLRAWDMRWSTSSVPTSLGVFWAENIVPTVAANALREGISIEDYLSTRTPADQLLRSLEKASNKLTADFGKWQTPWGEINRFQRLTGDIVHPFDDSKPSIPVGFVSGNFGSLASYAARRNTGTKKIYGSYGNSFVAVVEFGKTVRAKAVTAGGESGDPKSKHFNDQAERYSTGSLREVYFYPGQLKGNTERKYQPGK